MNTTHYYAASCHLTVGHPSSARARRWPWLPGEWRKGDCENCASTIAFVQEISLMLTHDAVGHKEAESGPTLLGREMRFKEVVAMIVRYARPIVGDAEEWPAASAPTGRGDVAA